MKPVFRFILIVSLIHLVNFVFAGSGLSEVTLPYSTTFNCAAWNGQAPWPNCDGIMQEGNFGQVGGLYSTIDTQGNNSAGGGGKGFRVVVGDGQNQNTDTLMISHTPVSEVWYRAYIRWQAGFKWSSLVYYKIFYQYGYGAQSNAVVDLVGMDNTVVGGAGAGNGIYGNLGGWTTIMGGSTSDGKWHCFELHMKVAGGILDLWIDDRLYMHVTGLTYDPNFQAMRFLSNQAIPGNGKPMYVDIDDIAISATGRIGPIKQTIFFQEGFNDNNLSSRGWFDDSSMALDSSTKYAGGSSYKMTWAPGATSPTGGGTYRHNIATGGTEQLYASFYWRFDTTWIGSLHTYHPHIINILSDLDDPWDGPAYNYLDSYIETGDTSTPYTGLVPRLGTQDGRNINYSYGSLPNDLTTTTENRDVGGCNGDLRGSDPGTTEGCYLASGSTYWNGRQFDSPTVKFQKNTWHYIEVFFKMNSISGGRGQPDGIMWMKVDGSYAINKTNILYRTNQNPAMKWKTFVIAPYIGDGSSRTQTMWMDELTVADRPPGDGGPSLPTGLRIIR
jgi:hypothetical protein